MTIACLQCAHTPLRQLYGYSDYAAAVAPDDKVRSTMLAYVEANPDSRFEAFMACDACGLVQIDPIPSPEVLGKFYRSYFGNAGYAKKLASKLKRGRRRVKGLKRYVASGSFLDVGCNIGCAVEAARQLGFKATGIEIGSDAVDQAKQLFPENRFFATTAEAFAEQGEAFDLVYCTEVIEHVPDPVGFVQALAKLVKPGGVLFLTTPDAGHWRRPKAFLQWHEVKPPEHVTWQSKRSLTALFGAHGFEAPYFRFNWKPGIKMVARRKA